MTALRPLIAVLFGLIPLLLSGCYTSSTSVPPPPQFKRSFDDYCSQTRLAEIADLVLTFDGAVEVEQSAWPGPVRCSEPWGDQALRQHGAEFQVEASLATPGRPMRWFEPKLRFDPGPRAERIWFTDGEKIELAGWDRARLSSVSTIDGSQREVSLAARLADLDVNVWIRLVHPDHTWTRKYGPPRATYDDGFQQRVVDFAIGVAEDLREALRIPEDDLAD